MIIAAISELERHLILERVRSGMRRAKSEGRRLGRPPLQVDVESLVRDRQGGLSMSQLANRYEVAESTVRGCCGRLKVPRQKGRRTPPPNRLKTHGRFRPFRPRQKV